MSILVSGSIACDTILEHDGSIGRRLENGDMHHLNATFLAPRMRVTLGGCATNIAFEVAKDILPANATSRTTGSAVNLTCQGHYICPALRACAIPCP